MDARTGALLFYRKLQKMEKKEIEHFNETVKTVLKENDLFVTQKYLYHYTDIYGLEGIVKNKELWLSERNYMNDVNDEKFIQDYIKHYFKNPIIGPTSNISQICVSLRESRRLKLKKE